MKKVSLVVLGFNLSAGKTFDEVTRYLDGRLLPKKSRVVESFFGAFLCFLGVCRVSLGCLHSRNGNYGEGHTTILHLDLDGCARSP